MIELWYVQHTQAIRAGEFFVAELTWAEGSRVLHMLAPLHQSVSLSNLVVAPSPKDALPDLEAPLEMSSSQALVSSGPAPLLVFKSEFLSP